ncbi:unnamed protein product, partial [marine sediment metagenome]
EPLIRLLQRRHIQKNQEVIYQLYARLDAASSLGKIGDARAVEPLIQSLNDSNERFRGQAAVALGELKDNRAVEPLIKALKDKDKSVRKAAAQSLGFIGDKRATDILVQIAKKDNAHDVRCVAITALWRLKDMRLLEILNEAIKNEVVKGEEDEHFMSWMKQTIRELERKSTSNKNCSGSTNHKSEKDTEK